MRLLPLLLLTLACDPGKDPLDSGTDSGGGDDGGWCGVQAVLDGCTGCHSGGSPSGGLDLATDAYAALVDQPSNSVDGRTLVIPGDAENSFLYAKVTGALGDGEGQPMPSASGLGAADAELIRAWIADGASSECSDTGGGDTDGYHPDGWSASDVHGLAAKLQEQECRDCHGDDLTGGDVGVSCDSCHPADWRTTCTFCHGGGETDDGAPPVSIDGTDDDHAFGAHTTHVTETIKPAYDCVQCHAEPSDVLSVGHLFVDDVTAGEAEVGFGGGIASGGSRGAASCTVYCHGNGRTTGTVDQGDAPTCGDCHAVTSRWGSLSEPHEDHLEEGVRCAECHADTVDDGNDIVDPTVHVDGDVDLALPSAVTQSGGRCTGTCHGEDHRGEPW